jgi:hypothetical protein
MEDQPLQWMLPDENGEWVVVTAEEMAEAYADWFAENVTFPAHEKDYGI